MYTRNDAEKSYIGKCEENDEIFKPDDTIYYCLELGKWLCAKCKEKHRGDPRVEYKLIVLELRELDIPFAAHVARSPDRVV